MSETEHRPDRELAAALSVDALEGALLAALLIDPESVAMAAGLVRPADLLDRKHRLVYEAILAVDGGAFDLVADEMARRGTLDEVGTGYLTALCLRCPSSLLAPRYAARVAEAAAIRRGEGDPPLGGLTGVRL